MLSDAGAPGRSPAPTRWERAHLAFETPEQELAKFIARLREIGADRWDRTSRVLEVCSGRGNGIRAWPALGFGDVIGVDELLALIHAYVRPQIVRRRWGKLIVVGAPASHAGSPR